MARSRYDVMKKSTEVVDENGEFYFDPLSFPITKFKVTKAPFEVELGIGELSRIDILMYRAYGTPQYDDIVMWLNNVGILDDVEPGLTFYLPDRDDIESFILDNQIGR